LSTTTVAVDRQRVAQLVDAADLRRLFVYELGWSNPDRPPFTATVDGQTYTLEQVAGHKGLRVWQCGELPPRRVQRVLDAELGRENAERLIVFTNGRRQEWRWPRKAQTGGVNAKLLVHPHTVGERDDALTSRLAAIALDFNTDVPLIELLARMRAAFDAESETASAQAARLMNSLYEALAKSKVNEDTATLLLARVLFLLFADDSDMWITRPDLFKDWLRDFTKPETLHADLVQLFDVLDTSEKSRQLPQSSPLRVFRYVNGGLFHDKMTLPRLAKEFRDGLLEACEFDWARISPAIFGSMFQTVKSKEARRSGGEHYTTEENILRTLRPLLLDELHERLLVAWDDKAKLTRLINDLGNLRVLDPACGCGNFLIVAYREMRALELEALKRRAELDVITGTTRGPNRSQGLLDATELGTVSLDHFAGIEIDAWPARIASVAMLLVDHLANQRLAEEFGGAPDRLPIRIQPKILAESNALRTDWATIFTPSTDVVIVGNPPFNGARTLPPHGRADLEHVWGGRLNPNFDYVTGWYAKTLKYFGETNGRWAFVSTNSICQGEPVADLWEPILEAGWRCRFAHRSFRWQTEAADGAAVHVSIVGFDRRVSPPPALWSYGEGGRGSAIKHDLVVGINPYLVDGPNVLVRARRKPLSPDMPPVAMGSKAIDGGNLLVGAMDYAEVAADPIAVKYLRPFVQARELIHGEDRWCLWLVDAPTDEIMRSPVLARRIAAVREFRQNAKWSETIKAAAIPHLLQVRTHTDVPHLVIPRHVAETRPFFPSAHFGPEVIAGDANFVAEDPDGFGFAVISSSAFITWQRAVGGRIKSDLRFSGTFTWNTFPLPRVSDATRHELAEAGRGIVEARAAHPGQSLSDLYAPGAVPRDVLQAHAAVDRIVDGLFGLPDNPTIEERQEALFEAYALASGRS
jgi:hypothetical protein